MQIQKLSETVFYIPNATNIGVLVNGKNCVLVDSGIDSEAGKKVLKCLEENQLSLKAIIITHAHADHFGASQFLKQKTNCQVLASKTEAAIIENPILEPLYLFSGANPIQELKNRFLLAPACKVGQLLETGKTEIAGISLEIVPLPGHSLNQIGVSCQNVLFCADALFSLETLQKHKLLFCTDLDQTRKTLQKLGEMPYQWFVPSHGEPLSNPQELVQANLAAMEQTEQLILEALEKEQNTEQLLETLCNRRTIQIASIQQFYLLKTTLSAYLECLYSNKKITLSIDKNQAKWKKT